MTFGRIVWMLCRAVLLRFGVVLAVRLACLCLCYVPYVCAF